MTPEGLLMRFTEEAIRSGFKEHGRIYHDVKGWKIPDHIRWWRQGAVAFEQKRFDEYAKLHKALRGYWQVFRGFTGRPWDARRTFDELSSLDTAYRSRRLSSLEDADVPACSRILDSMRLIKPNRHGPSVVAISKVLHFWNPRLFIVVDDAVMWRWVLAHGWLRRPIKRTHARIASSIGRAGATYPKGACDLHTYLAILRWGADVVRTNPEICPQFVRHVNAHRDNEPLDIPVETYEAAALEWLLLGLTEVPPPGVTIADEDVGS